ncbi:MAG: hypothetical protein ACYTEE_08010 [Planctomycetota bacterium]|jgi:predicted RNase H-like nuclease (RuvC/YqgF family)
MERFRKIKLTFFYILILISISGCITVHETPPTEITSATSLETDNPISIRFQEPDSQGPTPVETAIEISEKYAKAVEEASQLREQNSQLSKQNSELNAKLDGAKAKLSQTEQELKEANDMLIDMRIELNNWKMDVLSFRDEMRKADKAELQALLEILKTLGGETNLEGSTIVNEILSDPNEPRT